MGSYVLKHSQSESRALDLQQKNLEKCSVELLNKANLKEGDIVLDVGCGNGAMTTILSKMVGPSGKVIALDSSDEQLKRTRARLLEAGFTNVEYVKEDLNHWKFKQKYEFDLIYSRFIFIHLKKRDSVINNLIKLLKNQGRFIFQESTWSRFRLPLPEAPVLKEIFQAFRKVLEHHGVDYEYGDKILSMTNRDDVLLKFYEERLFELSGSDYADITSIRLGGLEEKILFLKLATLKDLQRWREHLMKIRYERSNAAFNFGTTHHAVFQKI